MSQPGPEPTLPDQSVDDTDRGWGEHADERDPHDVQRFLEERPPHHGDV
jgi:hypothetical protein